jgi:hypothetical protein
LAAWPITFGVVESLPAHPIVLNDLNLETDFGEGSRLSLNIGKQAVTPFQNTAPNSSAKLGGTWRKKVVCSVLVRLLQCVIVLVNPPNVAMKIQHF